MDRVVVSFNGDRSMYVCTYVCIQAERKRDREGKRKQVSDCLISRCAETFIKSLKYICGLTSLHTNSSSWYIEVVLWLLYDVAAVQSGANSKPPSLSTSLLFSIEHQVVGLRCLLIE